ncbi:carbohydrate ABC transporter permease (plasmid) [Aminobacter sp. UC22_36]|uniref:carbohydrate ABC transporter permease n=1 Tax=Aminobacter sp. UC22_36 TaxID=3374549 RepID=UPI003757EB07
MNTGIATAQPPFWRRVLDWGGVNYLFILPALAIYIGVIFLPILRGVDYAFTDWDGLSRSVNYVGFANFQRMFGDIQVRSAIGTTLIIAAALVVIKVSLGLFLALIVDGNLKSRTYLRVIFFMPVVLTPIIVSYMWKYIFSNQGPLNTLLNLAGFESLRWLGDPTLALISVIVVTSWQSVGLSMVIFLAGLQAVPPELNEAAMLDGASPWQRIRYVTIPMLAPAITVCVVIALIQGLRFFDQIYALTRGGPGYATETLSTMIYRISFQFGEFSYGAAVALVFSLIVAVIVLPAMHFLRKREFVHG